ncbi:MAG: hypothetical protein GX166_12175 [Clostridiaceae bacterium]|nr:hypothetical protein [Clostridiaceae bacterium]
MALFIYLGGNYAEIKHELYLDEEHEYRIVNTFNKISLYISEKLVAYVDYTYDEDITVRDSFGNVVGERVRNDRTPQFGFWKITVENLKGYIKDLEYVNSVVTQQYFPERDKRSINYET